MTVVWFSFPTPVPLFTFINSELAIFLAFRAMAVKLPNTALDTTISFSPKNGEKEMAYDYFTWKSGGRPL